MKLLTHLKAKSDLILNIKQIFATKLHEITSH